MKRHAKIVTACLVIAALMVNSVSACWLFARRARCQPYWTPCYAAPVVYDSCGMPSGAMSPGGVETLPAQQSPGGEGTTIMSPSMRMPWTQPQPGRTERREPTPAETRPARPTPSDRSRMDRAEPMPRDTGPATAPADRTETRREPMPEPEPMPPPRTEPSRTEPSRTAPGARAIDNPFESPSTTEPREPAPARGGETRPMPKADEDDPFAPRPTAPSATRPAERTPAADDPFAPRNSAPPNAPSQAPAGPRSNETPPADNPFAPKSTDAAPPVDDPFAPRTSAAKPPAEDPFAPPADAAKAPMSDVKEAPMSDAKDASKGAQPSGDKKEEPAKDNPFAEPVGPRLSIAEPASEPADAMRLWTDVTGKHQVHGRMTLILVAESKVRILKETGKYTTVPFAKLSEGDRTFVAQHSSEPSLLLAKER